MKPNIIAHRGGKLWAPENTLEAFRKALEFGVYGIELDVHRLNGELVITHDLPVATADGAHSYPILSEVLSLVNGQCVLNIEVKNAPIEYPGIENEILEALRDYPRKDRIIFSSFDHALMRKLRRRGRQYQTAVLVNGMLENIGAYARKLGAKALHPQFVNLRADHVEAAHKAGLIVNAWTLNTPAEWESACRMGINGIVTDDPAGCAQFLATRVD